MTMLSSHLPLQQKISPRRIAISLIGFAMPMATIALMLFFALNTKAFLSVDNFTALISQNAAVIIITVAFAMLLMAGYVDLSVGSVMGLTGVVAGLMFLHVGVVAGIVSALALGLAWGLMNGVLIGVCGLSPIVVTLGGLAAARGVALALAPNAVYGFPDFVVELGSGRIVGLAYIGWIALAVAAAGIVVMAQTPFGKHILAIGINARAAFLVGVRVKRTILLLYTMTGLAVALGALLIVARLDSAPSGTLGVGMEITVLTAALLGGIPFTGGRGSMWRVLLGIWFLIVLRNGLALMNVGTEFTNIISGSVLVAAAGLEMLQMHLRKRG
ncbi:ABC transporter permease [Methylopila musalis]|uniref:ABC transporter permease n=1 Tax=Methylopila musalis TaxID=1134781 RepID=A0ABW3Z367_9HYPH